MWPLASLSSNSYIMQDDELLHTACGTPHYVAPEVSTLGLNSWHGEWHCKLHWSLVPQTCSKWYMLCAICIRWFIIEAMLVQHLTSGLVESFSLYLWLGSCPLMAQLIWLCSGKWVIWDYYYLWHENVSLFIQVQIYKHYYIWENITSELQKLQKRAVYNCNLIYTILKLFNFNQFVIWWMVFNIWILWYFRLSRQNSLVHHGFHHRQRHCWNAF